MKLQNMWHALTENWGRLRLQLRKIPGIGPLLAGERGRLAGALFLVFLVGLVVILRGSQLQPSAELLNENPGREVVLFTDDFSPPDSAWALFDTESGGAEVRDGQLYLEDRGKGVAAYTTLVGRDWADTVISLNLRQVEGSMNNWMGVTCRQQDEENYYLFAISADGYYLILKMEDGVADVMIPPTANSAIQTGRNPNQLKVRCQGNSLSMEVNGRLLVSRADNTFAQGGISLVADAVEPGSPTTVAFDRLVIAAP